MADVIVIREDVLRRPQTVEFYPEGAALPDDIDRRIQREKQVLDQRTETKAQPAQHKAKKIGGPWYQLPTGEKVKGKAAVRDAGYEVP